MKKRLTTTILLFGVIFTSIATPALGGQKVTLVKNINKDELEGNANVSYITRVGDIVFFSADNGINNEELWKSDGTGKGTVMVKNIAPGESIFSFESEAGSRPRDLLEFNGELYFTADDGVNGRALWRSDGTEEGTVIVKGASSGLDFSIDRLVKVNNQLYFSADDGVHGWEPWTSDGTEEGTYMIKDIDPQGSSGNAGLYGFGYLDGFVYFRANDGVHGNELWKSDGTEEGTNMVADINPDGDSNPYRFHAYKEKMYFTASDGQSGFEIWRSDGTTEGTELLKEVAIGPYAGVRDIVVAGKYLLFRVSTGSNFDILWRSNGSKQGTVEVRRFRSFNLNPFSPFSLVVGDTLLFWASNDTWGTELWKSNGTSAGTAMVEDINYREKSSHPREMTLVGTTVYFTAYTDRLGRELWRTSGNFSNATLVWDVNRRGSGFIGDLELAGNTLFMKAETELFGSEELFKLDVSPYIPWGLLLED